jgi:hypothetical protein
MITIIHEYCRSLNKARKSETRKKTQLSPKRAKDCGTEFDHRLFLELPIRCILYIIYLCMYVTVIFLSRNNYTCLIITQKKKITLDNYPVNYWHILTYIDSKCILLVINSFNIFYANRLQIFWFLCIYYTDDVMTVIKAKDKCYWFLSNKTTLYMYVNIYMRYLSQRISEIFHQGLRWLFNLSAVIYHYESMTDHCMPPATHFTSTSYVGAITLDFNTTAVTKWKVLKSLELYCMTKHTINFADLLFKLSLPFIRIYQGMLHFTFDKWIRACQISAMIIVGLSLRICLQHSAMSLVYKRVSWRP